MANLTLLTPYRKESLEMDYRAKCKSFNYKTSRRTHGILSYDFGDYVLGDKMHYAEKGNINKLYFIKLEMLANQKIPSRK